MLTVKNQVKLPEIEIGRYRHVPNLGVVLLEISHILRDVGWEEYH